MAGEPSYFGNREAVADQVQTIMRRDPAKLASLMDANPMMGMMLASVFTPAQLSEMFADAGFSRNEPNPRTGRRDSDQQQQQPPIPMPAAPAAPTAPATQAQGGLVSGPGYYQQGGLGLPVPTDEQLRRAARSRQSTQQSDPWMPFNLPLVDKKKWEDWLRNQPFSENIEDRRNEPVPEEDRYGGRYFDMPLTGGQVYRQRRGGLVQLRADGGGFGDTITPEDMKQEAKEAEQNSRMVIQALTPAKKAKAFGFQRGGEVPYAQETRRYYPVGMDMRWMPVGTWADWRDTVTSSRADDTREYPRRNLMQRGGLTPSAMGTAAKQAYYTGLNTQRAAKMGGTRLGAISTPSIRLISSGVPGRVDRIPMRARTGSYVLPADVVSGLGQGNTAAGAKMWGQAISHSIGPMGIKNAIRQRSLKAPSLRMPSPNVNPRDYGGVSAGFAGRGIGSFDEGGSPAGDEEFTPIITAGGEIVVDPEIVCALGGGDLEEGKKMLGDSVTSVRKQTVQHLKQLPKPVE
jgi:hypothetical protein